MGRNDWYRRSTWTEADQTAFFARLSRSRSATQKAQYLRIQALYLQVAGGEDRVRAALALLDLMLEQYPDALDVAAAYLQKAECLLALGDEDGAIRNFRLALQRERERPNVITGASLEFGWMVVERGFSDLYTEALSVLEEYVERERVLPFPYQRYMVNAVRAVITEERGYHEVARECARATLTAAAEKDSGFRYHPQVGLVRDTNSPVYHRLKKIAAS